MDIKDFKKAIDLNPEILTNRNALVNVLKTTFPEEKANSNALISAYDAGLVEFLRNNSEISKSMSARFVRNIIDEYAIADFKAEWAVKFWAQALDAESEAGVSSVLFQSEDRSGKKQITCIQCQKKVNVTEHVCPYCGSMVFSDQFNDPSILPEFTAYLVGCSSKELISTIDNTYKSIKGSFSDCPKLGYNGCVVFAELLMLYRFLTNGNAKNAGTSIPALQFAIGLAFVQCSAGSFDNTMDGIISDSGEIDLQDWNSGYCYLKSWYNDEINAFEFSGMQGLGTPDLFQKYMEPVSKFSSDGECIQYFESLGLHFILRNEVESKDTKTELSEISNGFFRYLIAKQIPLNNKETIMWSGSANRCSQALDILKNIAAGNLDYYKAALIESAAIEYAKEDATFDYYRDLIKDHSKKPSHKDLIKYINNSRQFLNIQQLRYENNIERMLQDVGLSENSSIRECEIAYIKALIIEETAAIIVGILEKEDKAVELLQDLDITQLVSDFETMGTFDDENFIVERPEWMLEKS